MLPPYDERERFFTEYSKRQKLSEDEAVAIGVIFNLIKRDAEKHKTPESLADSVAAVTLEKLLHWPISDSAPLKD